MKKPIYFKQLDALRFVAFFLVFWHHGFQSVFANLFTNPVAERITFALTTTGGMGVHVFFVISGFLITFLMIREKESTGQVNVPFFLCKAYTSYLALVLLCNVNWYMGITPCK